MEPGRDHAGSRRRDPGGFGRSGRRPAIEKDLKTLEGEWTVESGERRRGSYTFKGDKLEVKAPSRSYKMTVKLDPTAKPEKTIDFQIDDGPEDAKGKTSKGIYKFEDDNNTFVFCMRPEGEPTQQVRADRVRANPLQAQARKREDRLQ